MSKLMGKFCGGGPSIIGADNVLLLPGFYSNDNVLQLNSPSIQSFDLQMNNNEWGGGLTEFTLRGYASGMSSTKLGTTTKRCIEDMSVLEILEYLNQKIEGR
jgi:hypothetical protein